MPAIRAIYAPMVGVFFCGGLKFGRQCGVLWIKKQPNSVGIPSETPLSYDAFVESDRNLIDILAKMTLS